MDPVAERQTPLSIGIFQEGLDDPPGKILSLPFSPYQLGLFVADIVVSFFCFYISSRMSPFIDDTVIAGPENVGVVLIAASLLLAFFPTYGLYSYHLIFNAGNHGKNLVKAFCWSLLMYAMVSFLYEWPALFSGRSIITGALIIIAAMGMALVARFFLSHVGNFIKATGISFVAVGVTGLLLGNRLPRLIENPGAAVVGISAAILFIALVRFLLVHLVYNKWLRRHFRRQIAVIGSNGESERIVKHIIRVNAPFWVVGLLSVNGEARERFEREFANKKYLGNIRKLKEVIQENGINEIIVTDDTIDKRSLIALLDFCVSAGIVVWFPPSVLPIIGMKLYIDNFCGLPMIRMCLQRNARFFSGLKRLMDVAMTVPLLVLLMPLFMVIALAVKLDSKGPVFYRAEAVGEGGRRFRMLKFRSMQVNGEHDIHKNFVTKFIKGEIRREQRENGVLKITEDPRVTRVGRILRKLSLDELPQLINVLKGEMSLIGPRPCLPYEYELYKDWHRKRNSVRPGITGLWQVAGRSEVSFEEMILLDLYYIYNRNLMMDINIFFETIFVVLGMKGAW